MRPTSPARRSPSTAAATWRSETPDSGRDARSDQPTVRRHRRRAAGGALVVHLLLLAAGGLLRAAPDPRRDGDPGRAGAAARALHRGVRDDARGGPGVRLAHPDLPAQEAPAVALRLLRRQPDRLLDDLRGRRHAVRAHRPRLLRLGIGVQPVRRQRVLEPDGRPLRHRAGEAPVRLHRRRRDRRGARRTFAHGAVRDAGRRERDAARVGGLPARHDARRHAAARLGGTQPARPEPRRKPRSAAASGRG